MGQMITDLQLKRLIDIFKELTGIQYKQEKIYLFENRLNKFVDKGSIYKDYESFIKALNNNQNTKLRADYINELTTNFTYFFREPIHFRFIQHVFMSKFPKEKDIRIWSAAASGGQEAYSVAITLKSMQSNVKKNFKIIGTDIATDKITGAKIGLYARDEIDEYMSPDSIKKYFNESKDGYNIKQIIKEHVHFAELNIMGTFPFSKNFHIIFLRNILLYFNNKEKEIILNKIANYLDPEGYLIISMSESLTGLNIPFKHIKHSIYIHTNGKHVL